MLASALFSSVSALFFLVRRGLKTLRVCGLAGLAICLAAGAQTAHYGTVVTLGSGFTEPLGVTVDANGNVFVSDTGNSAIKEIVAVNGNIPVSPTILTLGSGFKQPYTAAVDASGNVYVADDGNHAVREIEAVNGSIPASPTIRTLVSGTAFIYGTAVDSQGDVFYTEYSTNSVKEILAVNGVIPASPTIKTLGSGFNFPAGLALDASGNVFVGDQNNNVVKEILAAGGYTTVNTVATGFNTPDGVALDAGGNLYVADDANNLVKEVVAVNGSIPASPTVLTLPGSYSGPFDVAVDKYGNVYVADENNNAVKEIQVAGLNFGSVNVGATSASPLAVNFTFDTAGTLGSTTVLTQGATGLDFNDAGGGTCTANTAYNAGDVCTVNVTFTPQFPGARSGSVELLSTTGALIATGYVQGTGVAPQLTFALNASGTLLPAAQFSVGSGFSGPYGVAVDGSRNIFVIDNSANQLDEITAASALTSVLTLNSDLNKPTNVAVDGSGNVFVADVFNNQVKEFVAAGGYTTVRTIGSGFYAPYGVAVDGIGNVYVADTSHNAVKEILAVNGNIPATPTIRTLASGLSNPAGVAVDGSGNVFVANFTNGTVEEIVAVDGVVPAAPTINTIGTGFPGSRDVTVDASDNVYVADSQNNAVREILAAGGYTTVLTLGSGFSSPDAVAVDSHGNVLVADNGNHSVDFLDFRDVPSPTFADTEVGYTSSDSPQTVSVTNLGNAPLIFALPTSGTSPSVPAGFVWDPSSTCQQTTPSSPAPFQLAAGASCTMAFDFKPTTTGNISGFVEWTDNALNSAGNLEAIQLVGNGTAGPLLKLSATSLSFGSVTVGQSSGSQSVTLTNSGSAALTIGSIAVTGTNASSFVFANSCGSSLAVGASCSIHGHFAPTAGGALTATITIPTNAASSPDSIALSGTGLAPAVTLEPSTLPSFPATNVGQTNIETVTVVNTGAGTLTFSVAITGANANQFKLFNNCGTTVAPGIGCSFNVGFVPTKAGAAVATLTFTDNAAGSPQTMALSGTGVGPVTLSATSLTFPSTYVGQASASQSVTLTNIGAGPLSITSIAVTGTNASAFGFANSCGTGLAAGASCTIHGHFAPTSTGSSIAAITITDSDVTSPQTIALSGTGFAGPLTLSAKSLSFGSLAVGNSSSSQSVTVTNSGTAAVSFTSIAITGANASSFAFGNSCGTSLAGGASCTIHGHFAPMTDGALTAAITITDNVINSPQTIALSGTGGSPLATLSASSLSFPATTVGSGSASQSVTLTNTGTAALTITSIAVTGTNASQFMFANNCGASLAAGANCTIHGHFSPTASGAVAAAITITDSATGSPQSIALSGAGK